MINKNTIKNYEQSPEEISHIFGFSYRRCSCIWQHIIKLLIHSKFKNNLMWVKHPLSIQDKIQRVELFRRSRERGKGHLWKYFYFELACLNNDGLYVKMGQGIAAMDHLLPPPYWKYMSRLQDQAKSVEY